MHNCHAITNYVCAIAVNLCAKSIGICLTEDFLYLIRIWIIFCLNKGKTIDTGNDLCSILSKTIQNNS